MNSNKLVSLLKQFKLENRIVTDMNKMQKILETPIDYAGVNKIIMEETKRSITYLTQNIRYELFVSYLHFANREMDVSRTFRNEKQNLHLSQPRILPHSFRKQIPI